MILDIFIHSWDIGQTLKFYEIAPNFARFGTKFVIAAKFWYLDYKVQSAINHVAKFHTNRPRKLGKSAL